MSGDGWGPLQELPLTPPEQTITTEKHYHPATSLAGGNKSEN